MLGHSILAPICNWMEIYVFGTQSNMLWISNRFIFWHKLRRYQKPQQNTNVSSSSKARSDGYHRIMRITSKSFQALYKETKDTVKSTLILLQLEYTSYHPGLRYCWEDARLFMVGVNRLIISFNCSTFLPLRSISVVSWWFCCSLSTHRSWSRCSLSCSFASALAVSLSWKSLSLHRSLDSTSFNLKAVFSPDCCA